MRSTKITRSRVAAAAVALSMVAAGAIGFATTAQAGAATYQVTPKTGPGGDNNNGGNGQPASAAKVITITGTGNAFKTAAGTVKVATVTWATSVTACAQGSNSLAGFAVPTAGSVVVTIPADTLALAGTTTFTKKDYTLCVYDSTPTLLGTAKYTVYPTPTITAAVSPAKGPATGGNTIAIDGTGFTTTSVVKVGSAVATNVKVSSDGTSLTAKVPAGTASATAVQVTVTTEGGKNTVGNALHDDYTYTNAVAVSPATGDGTAGNVVTVTGNGFNSLTALAGVYLKQSAWTVAAPGTACSAFQVVSDTQLVCTLPVLATDGPYTVFVVGDNTVLATASVISASATYTVADF
jgi:hypothetical protein